MPRLLSIATCLVLVVGLSGCASRKPSGTGRPLQTREGVASFDGSEFHGKRTASGIRFDMNAMVAAHPSYPFGTLVRVTNLTNRQAATVRVVDRGPAAEQQADGVIIDVSRRAAQRLGFVERGRTRVRVEVLSWGR
jgi:rare lipoprotein A